VLETAIGQTRELWPLYVNGTNATDQGLSPAAAAAIEGLFQNMTLALLARPCYLAATTPVDLGGLANAHIHCTSSCLHDLLLPRMVLRLLECNAGCRGAGYYLSFNILGESMMRKYQDEQDV
jgi:hypothetical protein